jgi:hypothetical protein
MKYIFYLKSLLRVPALFVQMRRGEERRGEERRGEERRGEERRGEDRSGEEGNEKNRY